MNEMIQLYFFFYCWSLRESATTFIHSLTHSLIRSFAQSLNRPITHSLNHSITQALKHSSTQALKHSITQSLNHSFMLALWHRGQGVWPVGGSGRPCPQDLPNPATAPSYRAGARACRQEIVRPCHSPCRQALW